MSALAHAAPAAATGARAEIVAAPATGGAERIVFRAGAFFALAAFAALEYATLITRVPSARVLGVAAIASAGGALLALTPSVSLPLGLSTWLRVLVVVTMLALSLLVIGVPAGDLRPADWGRLAHAVTRGVDGLKDWLWPYRGSDRWSRLAVLMVIPAALVSSACICFWPARRAGWARSVAALAVLLALYLTGLANAGAESASGFQGAALLVLIAAWLWAPTIAASQLTRAAGWLVLCGALALIAAPALSANRPWIDYRQWVASPAGQASTFQWDQLYGPLPWPRSPQVMFSLDAPTPALVRVTSLDRFDGLRFLRSTAPPGAPRLDLADPGARGWYTRVTVQLAALQSNLLANAGGVPVKLHWIAGSIPPARLEADGTVQLGATPRAGSLYAITSYVPRPSASAMRRAPRAFPRIYLPYVDFALPQASASAFKHPDLAAEARTPEGLAQHVGPPAPGHAPAEYPQLAQRIESSPYAPMFALARSLAAGARTSYDVVERVERYLLSNYSYDENVPQARYPLEAFLFSQRRGYCQQFSGAMALMLRMDGIPARVGAGFKPQVFDPRTAVWRVRALDAHSWVEVFFTGIGWVSFDPTPPRPGSSATGAASLLSKGALVGSGRESTRGANTRANVRLAHARRAPGGIPLDLLAIVIAALLALVLLASWFSGRRRLRLALEGDASGAIAELRWALARLGYPHAPGVTLAQLECQLPGARGEASSYLASLRSLRYSGAPATRPSARGRAALRAALAGSCGRLGRVRALLALPPGSVRRAAARASATAGVSGAARVPGAARASGAHTAASRW